MNDTAASAVWVTCFVTDALLAEAGELAAVAARLARKKQKVRQSTRVPTPIEEGENNELC